MKKVREETLAPARVRDRIRLTALLAMLAAMGIVLGKFLQIPIGNSIRISFENLPTLFAGVAFGPFCGAVVGLVEDLVGSILAGYAINPFITLGAASIGAVSGAVALLIKKITGTVEICKYLHIVCAIFPAHLIGSVIIKSAALLVAFGTPYSMLALRIPIYLIANVAAESAIIAVLLQNGAVRGAVRNLRSK